MATDETLLAGQQETITGGSLATGGFVHLEFSASFGDGYMDWWDGSNILYTVQSRAFALVETILVLIVCRSW